MKMLHKRTARLNISSFKTNSQFAFLFSDEDCCSDLDNAVETSASNESLEIGREGKDWISSWRCEEKACMMDWDSDVEEVMGEPGMWQMATCRGIWWYLAMASTDLTY